LFEGLDIFLSGEKGSGFRGSETQWANDIAAQDILESFRLNPEPWNPTF
jgi:hypothetical protein